MNRHSRPFRQRPPTEIGWQLIPIFVISCHFLLREAMETVLVYDGSLAPQVEENGYFDFLIPVEKLFTSRPPGD